MLALSGGIGGAKLALGLYRILPPGALTVVANTGDDFEHLGFSISPDIDTLLYTLAGLDNPELGWGRRDETWTFMAALERLGGETWFNLGDGDLATHVERTRRLAAGESLSEITDDFRRRLGISARLLPMSDEPSAHAALDGRGVARFPGLFRAAALRADGPRDRLCRRRRGAAAAGFPGCARRRKSASGRDLPVEPVHQHRPDPQPAGGLRGAARLRARRSSRSRRSSAARRSRARPPR